VLVVGVEQMTATPGPEIGGNLLKASYLPEEATRRAASPASSARSRQRLFPAPRRPVRCAGRIAAKNHRNGVGNPYAQMRKDLGFEFCRAESEKNPFVAGPLKRTDCSLVSDGAAALVLADVDRRCS
jgi:acetyl-CoA C-acetyltransferase